MSAFTPGPWSIDGKTSTHVVAPQRGICSTGGHYDNSRDPDELAAENDANARLIAEAPEMYEAAYTLAMLVLQSERYRLDPYAAAVVDTILALKRRIDGEEGSK